MWIISRLLDNNTVAIVKYFQNRDDARAFIVDNDLMGMRYSARYYELDNYTNRSPMIEYHIYGLDRNYNKYYQKFFVPSDRKWDVEIFLEKNINNFDFDNFTDLIFGYSTVSKAKALNNLVKEVQKFNKKYEEQVNSCTLPTR